MTTVSNEAIDRNLISRRHEQLNGNVFRGSSGNDTRDDIDEMLRSLQGLRMKFNSELFFFVNCEGNGC